MPDISYFILDFNPLNDETTDNLLTKTLGSLYTLKDPKFSTEIFLLDQGGDFTHRKFLDLLYARYKFNLLSVPKNIGISGGINKCVRLCKAPVIGFLSSDVSVTKGFDLDLHAKVQIPEVYQAVPLTDKSQVPLQIYQHTKEYGSPEINLPFSDQYIRTLGVEYNLMFWRKEIFDKIGYIDERWKFCYENNDYALRCYLDGGVTAISRNSFVWHYHNITMKNGASAKIYDDMPNGLDHGPLYKMWCDKWRGLEDFSSFLYREVAVNEDRSGLKDRFKHNIYLPYE